ncbi:MAG: pyridoxal phosphate-dependent aminotransferase [Desulfurococcales archaeon]|nr:pyridoxal phosphate-dependent aminotransferase [Desulfurococcales archaeon]
MVSRRIASMKPSVTKAMSSLASEYKRMGLDYYSLHAGQPGFPPAKEAVEYVARRLMEDYDRSLFAYTPSEGLLSLREAIADDLEELGRPRPDPYRGIVVTSGGMEAVFSVISALTEPGDPVGVVIPAYFQYFNILSFLSVRIIKYNTYPSLVVGEDGWHYLFSNSKVVVISNPDNPTSRTLDWDEARLLADLACDYRTYLVHDVAYYTLYYEDGPAWPERYCWDHVTTVGSYSKDPGIPGWRLGYIAGPPDVVQDAKKVREIASYNPPTPSQILVEYYLKNKLREKHLPSILREYARRRDALIEALKAHLPNVKFKVPKAGMFIYADFSSYITNGTSEDLAWLLAKQKRVFTVPGTAFGEGGEKHLRLSFSFEPPSRISHAVSRIRDALEAKT